MGRLGGSGRGDDRKTSTSAAPWIPVDVEDKNYARIKVMKTVIRSLKQALD